MANAQSVGVTINEIDITTVVPGVATAVGALAGVFRWGPIGERMLIDSELNLVARTGKPTNFNAETWFSGANFLAYSNALQVVRGANTSGSSPIITAVTSGGNSTITTASTANLASGMILVAANADGIRVKTTITSITNSTAFVVASANDVSATNAAVSLQFVSGDTVFSAFTNTGSVATFAEQIVKTRDDFISKNENGNFDSDIQYIAKWAGDLGNSLKVSQVTTATGFSSNVDLSNGGIFTGSINFTVDSNTAVVTIGANTNAPVFNVNTFNSTIASTISAITIGDYVLGGNSVVGEQKLKVKSVSPVANIGLNANSSLNVALTSASANITTTANGFSALSNGNYIAVYSNTTSYSTFQVVNVVNGNTVVLSANAGVTNAAATWAVVNASSRSITLSLDDRYKRSQNTSSVTLKRSWEFADTFNIAPGQSSYVRYNGNSTANDELHLVVVDEDGKFTGVPGTILEKWSGLSRATDAKTDDGAGNYYKDVLNLGSSYVWAVNDVAGAPSNTSLNVVSASVTVPFTASFAFGADGADEANIPVSIITDAYDKFESTEEVDIGLIITGKSRGGFSGGQLANYLIDNIAEKRMDSIVFVSPDRGSVINNVGREATSIVEFRNTLRSTSYAFLDSGYKYQYDKYNDLYRYIPLNGDIAGLTARTEQTNDAWWSMAGLNRGKIKNIVRLAYNPRQADRDLLYKNAVNPVVSFPGDGPLLYGDKTLLAKPSSFDRINVRRLFIVIEKAIAKAAKYTLFEFNDPFTRAQFRNIVIPYLRDIQGRRGINDFLVVCDNTNNDANTIDHNEFNADIYIKANRSINFINLNFYNVPNGVAFSEVIGTNQ